MEQIFQILNGLNIPYELQEHKAIFSEEEHYGHTYQLADVYPVI